MVEGRRWEGEGGRDMLVFRGVPFLVIGNCGLFFVRSAAARKMQSWTWRRGRGRWRRS